MPPPLQDLLESTLGQSYTIERELVGGGMARLFLATEQALGRRVVIKVLPPELVRTLSADRFRREMELAAGLQHPHIIPVLTTGRTGDLLFYTMPYVEGESLRSLLDRQGELPVPYAIRLLSEIARALGYAHRRGVIHRDIKPGNILVADGEAQVADFGLAKALSNSAESDRLTSSGLVVGTPLYMAPEQTAARAEPDPRSDLYSLGVVAYEMITGSPPFSGPTAAAIMAAHALEQPVPVASRRSAVPAPLDALVMRLLEKSPADRIQSADEVLRALESDSAPAFTSTRRAVDRRSLLRWSGLLATAITVTLGLSRLFGTLPDRTTPAPPDSGAVAVLPFRVEGADSSLRYLREGMIDLLALRLSGSGGLRAVDPRTLLAVWRRAGGTSQADLDRGESLRLARRLGARSLLAGEVVGTPGRLALSATIAETTGAVSARASVEGPSDSLASMVDRLAVQLLAATADEPEDRLTSLSTASLPALRAYLDGMSAYRGGKYHDARSLFLRALAVDSTFAAAALGRIKAGVWLGELDGRDVAWRLRHRLPRRDRLLIYAIANPHLATARADIDSVEALVGLAPDDPAAWADLGDRLFHYGTLAGISNAPQRALRASLRAVRLGPTYAPAYEHLYELHYVTGDRAAAKEALGLLIKGKARNAEPVARWFARVCLGDTVNGITSLPDDGLVANAAGAIGSALRHGCGLAQAESLLIRSSAAVVSVAESRSLQALWWTFYVSRGRPAKALAGMSDPADRELRAGMILDALYAGGDTAHAARLAESIPRRYSRPTAATRWEGIVEGYAAAQFDLVRGKVEAAQEAVEAWRGSSWAPRDTAQALRLASYLSLLLDAQLAARLRRFDALARLEQLDSVLVQGPTYGGWLTDGSTFGGFEPVGNLIAARLWHERGAPARALATARRRAVGVEPRAVYLSLILDEARYAALVGNASTAIQAYQHYLTVRAAPEPTLRAAVQEVQAELDALRLAAERLGE